MTQYSSNRAAKELAHLLRDSGPSTSDKVWSVVGAVLFSLALIAVMFV